MGISNFVNLPEVQGEDHFPWIQPINLPSLRGAQGTAYLGLLLAPARLPSCPIPLLWEVRSGPPGKVPLKNILHDYPRPLHLSLSPRSDFPEAKTTRANRTRAHAQSSEMLSLIVARSSFIS